MDEGGYGRTTSAARRSKNPDVLENVARTAQKRAGFIEIDQLDAISRLIKSDQDSSSLIKKPSAA
jgi:hypothetical protein